MAERAFRIHRGRGRWSMERAAAHAALLGMAPGSEWAMIWAEQPVRLKEPAELFFKRAADPEDLMYRFKVGADEARPMVGFAFELFGRLVDEPVAPFYWHLAATGGLEQQLRIEVWWLEVPMRAGLRALRTHEPLTGADRKVIEVTGANWEGGIDRARNGLRALDMKITSAGGRPKGKKAPDPGFVDRFNRALRKRYDDGFTERPSQAVVAAEMGESEDTLQRRVKDGVVSWPPSWPPM